MRAGDTAGADGGKSTSLLEGQPLLSMAAGKMQRASFFDTLESEPETVPIIANPTIAPYVLSLVERPMLEQFSLTFMFRGGEINAHAGHTPYQSINGYQVNNGRIYCNHLRVMYYLTDVIPGSGDGGLFILPVCHSCDCIVSLSNVWHHFQDSLNWMVLLMSACVLSRRDHIKLSFRSSKPQTPRQRHCVQWTRRQNHYLWKLEVALAQLLYSPMILCTVHLTSMGTAAVCFTPHVCC